MKMKIIISMYLNEIIIELMIIINLIITILIINVYFMVQELEEEEEVN